VTLQSASGLFFVLLGLSALGGFAQFWVLVEMTQEINRKRASGQKVDPFALSWHRTSWYQISREYRALFPQGSLSRFEIIAIGTTVLCGIGAAYLLFGALPKWALPSR